ncbi:DNA polymerase zeta catalytic subunit isoform X2 [Photinus pyralis]|uniref:DNA polymerase zeta catalytic subunit isoform X2 n=1 Tax=Photinus pyralis TaxID=7054 RepID=UPI0012675121|nr:DNA polymerase zeta catalytic subunit isoform X2 [Photinus pyralis]
MFLVRIFSVDFYMSAPIEGCDPLHSDFRGTTINNVPVIRIFGSTETGIKTCLHIHGVFPYLYVPFDGSEDADSVMYQIANKIDQAINISSGHSSSSNQHVYKIILVSGRPFYGYHPRDHLFLKIYFYNPLIMRKACNLLQNGNVFEKVYQLHEAHIPFILQFMIDYNLHGMNFISLSEVRYRNNPDLPQVNIPKDLLLPTNVAKCSTSHTEVDGLAENIINRLEIIESKTCKNPGIEALWEDEKQRKRNQNDSSQLSPCLSQNRMDIPPTDSHNFYKTALNHRLYSNEVNSKVNQDLSVYPIEAPKSHKIISASFVDHHSGSSGLHSSNSLPIPSHSSDEYSFFDSTVLDSFNDTQSHNLLNILHDLAKDDGVEEDSILSQTIKPSPESEDEDHENDMVMPLVTTPFKNEEDGACQPGMWNAESVHGDTLDQGDHCIINDERVNHLHSSHEDDAVVPMENNVNLQNSYLSEQVKRKLHFMEMEGCAPSSPSSSHNLMVTRDHQDPDKIEVSEKQNSIDRSQQEIWEGNRKIHPPVIDDANLSSSFLRQSLKNSSVYQKKEDAHYSPNHNMVKNADLFTPYSRRSSNLSEKFTSGFDLENNEDTGKLTSTQNLSKPQALINTNGSQLGMSDYYVLIPKFNPPSRDVITKTMSDYDIPMETFTRPFCSNSEDAISEFQIGHKKLKIGTLCDVVEFENTVATLSLQQLMKDKIQKLHPDSEILPKQLSSIKLSFCNTNECLLTTFKLPPTAQEVRLWIEQQNVEGIKVAATKKAKQKILIPCNPNAADSDDSLMSMTPCSPISNSFLVDDSKTPTSSNCTPKSSNCTQRSRNIKKRSRTLSKRGRKLKKEFTTNDSELSLRKTLAQSQLLNNLTSSGNNVDSSHITGATPNNTHCFKASLENLQKARAVVDHQYLTILVMELHIKTRLDLKPDPEFDSIRAIVYAVRNDDPDNCADSIGVIAVLPDGNSENFKRSVQENNFNMRKLDPDVVAGYELQMLSWGYLLERGTFLHINLHRQLSRVEVKFSSTANDDSENELKLDGRIVLDVWRLMRHEIALQSYSFENIVYHMLHKRIPMYTFKDLSGWWEDSNNIDRHKTVNYYLRRVTGIVELFDRLDLIGRTSELARLFGIQFYEVLSRGSQFRVESMMLRLAKPLNYVAVSPSVQQRAKMKAPEYLPLILEPDSQMYVDPVIVFDFQSLYPSMIIAYNYCFSTCLGRVESLGLDTPFEFGATHLKVSPRLLKKLLQRDLITFSPCGVAYVKPKVREGILPRMLSEILDTRLMVKKSMKLSKEDKVLQRVLHSRQLGLKLIANVTYGYTAANFSGRMPAVELADSVVSKGRETLMRAIKLIECNTTWGAKVVYGDTDSIFVLIAGKSRDAAFKIGEEIAEEVTNDNPSPVRLKLEKIFQPCILQTKKRYVGYMYESNDQTEPEFCAKGIETVRRDGCPAVSKMLEKSLKILFDTRDVSLVRKYVIRQFTKMLTGRICLQDVIFAKEYRGAANYRPGACVPALELTRKWLAVDRRSEPRCGERVAYVIVSGPPGVPLIKLVRSPRELLADGSLRPNMFYYITRVIIPPLNRCFTLIGVDINKWFNSMPRKQVQIGYTSPDSRTRKTAISHYFTSTDCVICSQQAQEGICVDCQNAPQEAMATLQTKVRLWDRSYNEASLICFSCDGHSDKRPCVSLDCPVMYYIRKIQQDIQQIPYMLQIASKSLNLEF